MGLQNKKPPRDSWYQVVNYLRVNIGFGDTVVKVGTIPAGSLILKPISGVQIVTAFNAATTNLIDIGTPADDDLFATDLAAGTPNFIPLDESIGGFYVTADTEITATYAQSGTAATTGMGVVAIAFLPPH